MSVRRKKEKAGKVKAVSMEEEEEEGGIVAAPCAHANCLSANAFREPRTVLEVVEAYGAGTSYQKGSCIIQ